MSYSKWCVVCRRFQLALFTGTPLVAVAGLTFAIGLLFGLAITDFHEPEQAVVPPIIKQQQLADERAKLDTETCQYISLNGRTPGEVFTVMIHAGVTCLSVTGATK